MKQVSLLAPRERLVADIRAHYGDLVTPALLDEWTRRPETAPGRATSSPWPDHIEVLSITQASDDEFIVAGDVVERTSAEAAGEAANRVPAEIAVARLDDRWRITRYHEDRAAETGGPPVQEPTVADAVQVVRTYYDSIRDRRYREAYLLWVSQGAASGKSFDEFRAGFAETATVGVTTGPPGPMGAAAGSRYVEVPVRVTARTLDGAKQEFAGSYTLRRAVVDGATEEQRAWRIYSAKIRRVTPSPE